MNWGNPTMLAWLWVVPATFALLVYAHRKRKSTARRFADPVMAERLMPTLSNGRPMLKGMLTLLGLACLIVALARPQWGEYREMVTRRGVDMFVLLDVSRSMLAKDVTPDRLTRAKSDIKDLLTRLEGDRVGLIVFAGKPVMQVPLTTDQAFFRTVLDEVDPTSAPIGGSLIGDAIRKALSSMEPRADRDQTIVLITDGEDHDSFPEEAAKEAAERGVKIFAIGLGDPAEGARIPVREGSGFVKSEGQEVWSKMDEKLLQNLALTTDGAYIPAKTRTYDLGKVYDTHLAGLTRGVFGEERQVKHHERFQWFLAVGLISLLIESMISRVPVPKKTVPPATHPALSPSGRSRQRRSLEPVVAGVLLLLLPTLVTAAPRETVLKVREGLSHFEKGNYQAADAAFAAAEELSPEDHRVLFDRGCALAAQGELDKSIELFEKASLALDPKLAADAQYNLGDVYAQKARKVLGEKPEEAVKKTRTEGLELIGQAVDQYRNALRTDPSHAAARHNLELLRVWTKQIQAIWKERDKQAERDKLDPLAFLEMIESKQKGQRTTGKALGKEADSPRWRSALRQADRDQRELADEIVHLKDKIAGTLAQPAPQGGGQGPQPALSPEQQEQALQTVSQWTDAIYDNMTLAATNLGEQKLQQATAAQTEALEDLNRLYVALAPLDHVLQKSIQTQKTLVDKSQYLGETPAAKEDTDWSELSEEQTRVSQWSQAMRLKAEDALQQLAALPTEETSALPSGASAQPESRGENPAEGESADAEAAKGETNEEQQADPEAQMKIALETAVKLTPRIQALAGDAAQSVMNAQTEAALPKQEEALKLLKEIQDKLPKQKNDQNQQQNEQDQQDQQQQDQQNQDQQNKDQQNKDQQNPQQNDQQSSSDNKEQKDQQSNESQSDSKEKQDQESESKEQEGKDDKEKNQESKGEEDQPKDEPGAKDEGDKEKEQEADKQQPEEQSSSAEEAQEEDAKEQSAAGADESGKVTDEKIEGMFRRARQRQLEHKQRMKALERLIYGPVKVEKDW